MPVTCCPSATPESMTLPPLSTIVFTTALSMAYASDDGSTMFTRCANRALFWTGPRATPMTGSISPVDGMAR
jgi:hypothetical protein